MRGVEPARGSGAPLTLKDGHVTIVPADQTETETLMRADERIKGRKKEETMEGGNDLGRVVTPGIAKMSEEVKRKVEATAISIATAVVAGRPLPAVVSLGVVEAGTRSPHGEVDRRTPRSLHTS